MRAKAFFLILLTCSSVIVGEQSHDHGMTAAGDGQFNPFVIADNGTGYYVAYVERRQGKNNLFVRHTAGSGSASKAVRVNNREGDAAVRNENPPKLALGPRGEVYVAWANERERWKGNILFSRSTDAGKTFSPAIVLNSGANSSPVGRAFQSLAVADDGRIDVAWIDERNKTSDQRGAEVWMTSSKDGGRTFMPDRRVLSDVCECCRLTLVTQKGGRLYLSYRVVPSTGPMYRDIAVAHSEDGGRTFQTTIVNRDGWDINACPVAGPALSTDPSGRLTILWFTDAGGVPGLYYASSQDGARTFSPRHLLTAEQKLARHAHLASTTDGPALVAWDDMDGSALVRWGELDPVTHSLKIRGTFQASSYPVIASHGGHVAVVALQSKSELILEQILSRFP